MDSLSFEERKRKIADQYKSPSNLNQFNDNDNQNDDKRIVQINLDDAIILATDKDGNELLRLEIKVDDVLIHVRFPAYGKWDLFIKSVGELFAHMANYAENVEIPDDIFTILNEKQQFLVWTQIMQVALQPKRLSPMIESIFFDYLRPTVDGKPLLKEWARDNIGVDAIFRMFVAILCVDQWLKKNGRFILTAIFQISPTAASLAGFQKKQDTIITKSNNFQPFLSDSSLDVKPNIKLN